MVETSTLSWRSQGQGSSTQKSCPRSRRPLCQRPLGVFTPLLLVLLHLPGQPRRRLPGSPKTRRKTAHVPQCRTLTASLLHWLITAVGQGSSLHCDLTQPQRSGLQPSAPLGSRSPRKCGLVGGMGAWGKALQSCGDPAPLCSLPREGSSSLSASHAFSTTGSHHGVLGFVG